MLKSSKLRTATWKSTGNVLPALPHPSLHHGLMSRRPSSAISPNLVELGNLGSSCCHCGQLKLLLLRMSSLYWCLIHMVELPRVHATASPGEGAAAAPHSPGGGATTPPAVTYTPRALVLWQLYVCPHLRYQCQHCSECIPALDPAPRGIPWP